jgi:hypothetical protein
MQQHQHHMPVSARYPAPMRSHHSPSAIYHQELHPQHPEIHQVIEGGIKIPDSGRHGSGNGSTNSNPQIHHPVPYRHHPRPYAMHGYQNHYQYQHQHPLHQQHYAYTYAGGYEHDPQRIVYSGVVPLHTQHHTMAGPNHHFHPMETAYGQYQTQIYDAAETVMDQSSMGRSPSPPPAPPSARSHKKPRERAVPTPNSLASLAFKSAVDGAESESMRPESAASNATGTSTMNGKANIDDDAASILLQLSGVPSQSSDKDDVDDEPANEGRPLSTVNTHRNVSFPLAATSNMLKPIQASSSMDEDGTIATTESPDLTSEPSNDSNEVRNKNTEPQYHVPENYPRRLALEHDEQKLNSLHCFIREELLEIFVVQKSATKSRMHSPGSSVGRVGLRCVHCTIERQRTKENRDEAPMAVFYPKSIDEIYRLVTSWQRCHLRKCRNLPPDLRSRWQSLRETEKSRGKTQYWITSAQEIGLVNCQSRGGGIRFGPIVSGVKCTKKVDETHEQGQSNTVTFIENSTNSAVGIIEAAKTD